MWLLTAQPARCPLIHTPHSCSLQPCLYHVHTAAFPLLTLYARKGSGTMDTAPASRQPTATGHVKSETGRATRQRACTVRCTLKWSCPMKQQKSSVYLRWRHKAEQLGALRQGRCNNDIDQVMVTPHTVMHQSSVSAAPYWLHYGLHSWAEAPSYDGHHANMCLFPVALSQARAGGSQPSACTVVFAIHSHHVVL